MNVVTLIGRLTDDPDIRYTTDQQPKCVARYRLAVDRIKKGEADFISCVAFGAAGEFAQKYLHKGTKIGVTGSIRTGSYTKQDGSKAYTTDVIVNSHTFCESRKDAPQAGGQDFGDGFMAIPQGADDDGLPFN